MIYWARLTSTAYRFDQIGIADRQPRVRLIVR